ncbi:MAG TPA: hypothetical protein VJ814_10260, partial [Gaiellaceae bacterium]|nr:hypothetical protein [Gaiellaceae bacterium]
MIARADVARLCERAPTPESPVLSVYVDVDQSRAVNLNRGFRTAFESELRRLERAVDGRDGLHAAAEAVARRVDGYQPTARTLAMFADASAGLWWTGELRTSGRTAVRWEPTPYVRPLIEALDDHQRYGVVLVGKQRARLFTVFLDEIEEEREAIAAAEVRHKEASGTDHWRSQMHFQRQDEMHVQWHLGHVAAILAEVARERAFDRVVLAGPTETTSELVRLLPRPLADRVVGALRMPMEVAAAEVLHETLVLAGDVERAAERTRTDAVFERGTTGLERTLAALQQGRAWILVHAEGFESAGGECLRCGALFGPASGS